MSNLVAHNKFGLPVEIGSEISDFRGNKHVLLDCVRVNEFRYGGGRSGQVKVRDENGFESVLYDAPFGLTVYDMDMEGKE